MADNHSLLALSALAERYDLSTYCYGVLTGSFIQSGPVASVASVFMIFMIVVLSFPTTPGPVAQDMNYSSVVVGGTIILASIYYFVSGQFWFTGPVTTLQDECVEKRTSVGTSSQGSK